MLNGSINFYTFCAKIILPGMRKEKVCAHMPKQIASYPVSLVEKRDWVRGLASPQERVGSRLQKQKTVVMELLGTGSSSLFHRACATCQFLRARHVASIQLAGLGISFYHGCRIMEDVFTWQYMCYPNWFTLL